MASTEYAIVINVKEQLRREDGYWMLTSDDMPGLLLWGPDLDKLRADVPESIKTLFKLDYGMDVDIRMRTSGAMGRTGRT